MSENNSMVNINTLVQISVECECGADLHVIEQVCSHPDDEDVDGISLLTLKKCSNCLRKQDESIEKLKEIIKKQNIALLIGV